MTLFTNTHFRPPNSQTQTAPPYLQQKLPARIPGLGYILFPSPGVHQQFLDTLPGSNGTIEGAFPSQPPDNVESLEDEKAEEIRWKAENDHLDTLAQRRRELEAEEARRGEEDWVRSGGVLRDAEGRRDWARTQAVRDELKLRELEKQILDRWERYEEDWSNLFSRLKKPSGHNDVTFLRFEDIPWPIKEKPMGVEDLTVKGVEDFLLEALTVREVKIIKKDRVRSSFLRWHPDKLGSLFGQTHPEHLESVKQGVGIVMECLQRLNA